MTLDRRSAPPPRRNRFERWSTSIDNESSAKLLGKIGLRFERIIRLNGEEVKLFGWGQA